LRTIDFFERDLSALAEAMLRLQRGSTPSAAQQCIADTTMRC
jgi:hypothetical protein